MARDRRSEDLRVVVLGLMGTLVGIFLGLGLALALSGGKGAGAFSVFLGAIVVGSFGLPLTARPKLRSRRAALRDELEGELGVSQGGGSDRSPGSGSDARVSA
jgi:hypothetical protein